MTPEVQNPEVQNEVLNKDAQNPLQEKLELKYCEGCGALTMRATGSEGVYCSKCVPKFAKLAQATADGSGNAGRCA